MPPVFATDRGDTPRFSWYLHWKLPEPRLSWLESSGEWKPLVRAYLASISFMDSQVGRVLDALEEEGLADRTIVVLLSDHGWHLGEKAISGKNTLWDRSTRVPLIVAGPGVFKGGVCSRPAELLDVYPTLLEACGLPEVEGLEGHCSGSSTCTILKRLAEWPAITTHGPGNHGIRTEKWRFIRYADGSEELYDMVTDPHEWLNLASREEHSATKAELARWLPSQSADPLPGSNARLVEIKNGTVYWQNQPIGPNDPIPMDD